ncbi:MAG: hypothetical protein R3C44_21980 [Chloroflexota bacterium]
MISGQRLIVMAEESGPPPDWYDNVWTVTEETPYTFIFPEQFNCDPNRGDTGKPFFLLNHWIGVARRIVWMGQLSMRMIFCWLVPVSVVGTWQDAELHCRQLVQSGRSL